jgi:SOS-response transcriptional repressor LexA
MTTQQLRILRWIATYCRRGYGPTRRELCREFKWSSPHSAQQHVAALVRMGLMAQEERTSRTLAITPAGRALLEHQPQEAGA